MLTYYIFPKNCIAFALRIFLSFSLFSPFLPFFLLSPFFFFFTCIIFSPRFWAGVKLKIHIPGILIIATVNFCIITFSFFFSSRVTTTVRNVVTKEQALNATPQPEVRDKSCSEIPKLISAIQPLTKRVLDENLATELATGTFPSKQAKDNNPSTKHTSQPYPDTKSSNEAYSSTNLGKVNNPSTKHTSQPNPDTKSTNEAYSSTNLGKVNNPSTKHTSQPNPDTKSTNEAYPSKKLIRETFPSIKPVNASNTDSVKPTKHMIETNLATKLASEACPLMQLSAETCLANVPQIKVKSDSVNSSFPLPRLEKNVRYTISTPVVGFKHPTEFYVELELSLPCRASMDRELNLLDGSAGPAGLEVNLADQVAVCVNGMWSRGQNKTYIFISLKNNVL